MKVPFNPRIASAHPRALRRIRGLTLMETIIAVGILALTTMGGVAGYFLMNRYAANLRNIGMPRAICQERFEQAITLPFRPSTGTVPLAPSADPVNTASRAILGASTNYNTSGAFTAGANYQTSTETIPIYTQSDGTAAAKSANVTYVRTSTVSPTALVSTSGVTTGTSLNVVQFQVTVKYVFRGRSYSTSMSTLRGPD